jgi:hypothetical protein
MKSALPSAFLPPLVTVLILGFLWRPVVHGQEKVNRKTMIFQPGAKVPDGFVDPKLKAESKPDAKPETKLEAKGEPKTEVKESKETKAVPPSGMGAGADSADVPTIMAGKFFALLQKGQVENAYDGLTKGSRIAERPEESKALRAKTQEALQVFGSMVGFELVESKNVGGHLLRQTYLSIGKEFPLRWRLYFYKPDTYWRLVDIRVDDRIGGLFGEAEENRGPEGKP